MKVKFDMTNETSNEELVEALVELLDDVVNSLASYKLLQCRGKDRFGAAITKELIEKVKSQIETLGYNPKTLYKLED